MASITKRKMTDSQRKARLANLEKGRIKRMEALKQKKEYKAEEYDLSSEKVTVKHLLSRKRNQKENRDKGRKATKSRES